MKFALSIRFPISTEVVEIPVIRVVVMPMEPEGLVLTIPAALAKEFENDSAIVLYVVKVFINRQVRLLDRLKHRE